MSGHNPENRANRTFLWVVSIIGLYAAAAVFILPVASWTVPPVPAITPFVVGGILAIELATSFLLFARFRDTGTWSLLLLTGAYFWSGIMAIVHLLTFPDAVLPGRTILGSAQSASWTFQFWTNGYAGLALASIIVETRGSHRIAADRIGPVAACVLGPLLAIALCATVAATAMIEHMPNLMLESAWTALNSVLNWAGVAMMGAGVAIVLVAGKSRNELFLWLSLALTAMFFANILALTGGGRYTVGWTVSRLNWVGSACVLFLFFMNQFSRQQLLLARARSTLEQRVEERTADLTRIVRQRDLLLREVYHRVKNNLQIVNSLILLERRRLDDPAAKDALIELHNRIHTLGLVHQQLMSSDNLEAVSIAPFLRDLSDNVASSFNVAGSGIEVIVKSQDLTVDLDFAISVGLLATELLTNAIKHAKATTVTIEFGSGAGSTTILSVGDDGMNGEAGAEQLTARSGVGGKIVDGLTRQLQGQMEITHRDGMRVEIRMPMPEAV